MNLFTNTKGTQLMSDWKNGRVFLKATDKDGSVTYTAHNCWNSDLFLKSVSAAAIKEKGKVEAITEAEYKEKK